MILYAETLRELMHGRRLDLDIWLMPRKVTGFHWNGSLTMMVVMNKRNVQEGPLIMLTLILWNVEDGDEQGNVLEGTPNNVDIDVVEF